MRVLILAPQVPWPLQQGTAIRNHHIAVQLARTNEVTVVAFGETGQEAGGPLSAAGVRVVVSPPPGGRSLSRRFAELPLIADPDLARRLLDSDMAHLVAKLCAELADAGGPDIIQIEGLEMALYGLQARRALKSFGVSRPLVYDAHNAEWVLQHRAWQADAGRARGLPGAAYSLVQALKLRRFERRLLLAVDATVAVSDADARALAEVAPGAHITVVPNGVDLAQYRVAARSREDPRLCVFVGKMDFRPNIDAVSWFCHSVWPGVRAAMPQARFAIVGRDPVVRVSRLAGPGIEVTGRVADVRPLLDRAAVVVVPLRVGGGTRLKVLEAMAMGKAIVATSMAVEGLGLTSGVEVLALDDPADQAAAIVELAADPHKRECLGRAARTRVEKDFRWEDLVPKIESLQRRCVAAADAESYNS